MTAIPFSDGEGLQPYLPNANDLPFERIADFLAAAAATHLARLFEGSTLYASIIEGHAGEEALTLARRAIANLGFCEFYAAGHVSITGTGITEPERAARIDTLDKLFRSCQQRGHEAIEQLLRVVEAAWKTRPVLPEWVAGWSQAEGFTVLHEFPIHTADEFHRYVDIRSSRLAFLAMKPAMRRVLDLDLYPALGAGLLEHAYFDDDPTEPVLTTYANLLRPALAHLAAAYAIDEGAVLFDPTHGVLQFQNTGSGKMQTYAPAAVAAIAIKRNALFDAGQRYLRRALEWVSRYPDQFPEYQPPPAAASRRLDVQGGPYTYGMF